VALKTKVVALVCALLMALVPLSQMACAGGTCHSIEKSSPMPCHAMNSPKSDKAVESTVDHSCCRLLPVLPVSARDQMRPQRLEQGVFSWAWKIRLDHTISEYPRNVFVAQSPPWPPPQCLTSVLLI